jgi:hypothetical protein
LSLAALIGLAKKAYQITLPPAVNAFILTNPTGLTGSFDVGNVLSQGNNTGFCKTNASANLYFAGPTDCLHETANGTKLILTSGIIPPNSIN